MKTRNQAIDYAFSLLTVDEVLFRTAIKEQREYARSHQDVLSTTRYTKARVLGYAVGFIRNFFANEVESYKVIATGLTASQSAVMRLSASIAMHAIEDWYNFSNSSKLHRKFYGEKASTMFEAFLELEPWMTSNVRYYYTPTSFSFNCLKIDRTKKDERR
jgi:hypothetical protein